MSNENQLVKHDEGSVTFKGHDQSEEELVAQSDGAEEYAKGEKFYEEKNYPEALTWFKLAADLGHIDAMLDLGYMYRTGTGVEKSFAMARDYYSMAATKGSVSGEYRLGLLYDTWQGPEKDLSAAVYHYTISADRGDKLAAYYLGLMYRDGQGVGKNYIKATYYLDKATALERPGPAIALTVLYQIGGNGIEKNTEKAWYYADMALKKASQDANGDALIKTEEQLLHFLILICADFEKAGTQEAAINPYTTILAFNNISPTYKCLALSKLGHIYYETPSIEKNFEQAFHYHEMVSNMLECGESFNLPARSQAWLGRMYFVGRGVEKDTKKAFELLENAYKLGAQIAVSTLCAIYANGYEVEKDFKKAIPYCEQAKVDSIDNILGHLYYATGQYDKALMHLRKASDETNNQYAANMISVMYINGRGVAKDFETARDWAKKAGMWEPSLISLIDTDRTKLFPAAQPIRDTDIYSVGTYKVDELHFDGLMGLTNEEEQSLFGWSYTTDT